MRVAGRVAALRSAGLVCGHALTKGRTCCHVKGHEVRHSHSWHGAARWVGHNLVSVLDGAVIAYFPNASELAKFGKKIAGVQSPGYFTGSPVVGALPAGYHGSPDPYWCPHKGDIWICERCNLGLEREDGSTVEVATINQMRGDIDWHYRGNKIWMGRDSAGHDIQKEVRTGRVDRAYSENEKREALETVAEYGLTAASRKTGIPRTTLKNWHQRRGALTLAA